MTEYSLSIDEIVNMPEEITWNYLNNFLYWSNWNDWFFIPTQKGNAGTFIDPEGKPKITIDPNRSNEISIYYNKSKNPNPLKGNIYYDDYHSITVHYKDDYDWRKRNKNIMISYSTFGINNIQTRFTIKEYHRGWIHDEVVNEPSRNTLRKTAKKFKRSTENDIECKAILDKMYPGRQNNDHKWWQFWK